VTAALDLAARGSATPIGARAVTRRPRLRAAGTRPFDPPLYDTFAFITRRNAHLSPATREFMQLPRAGSALGRAG
jgi:hypothetical protein